MAASRHTRPDSVAPGQAPLGAALDMASLIAKVRTYLAGLGSQVTTYPARGLDLDAFVRKTGFAPRWKGEPELILGSQVGVELGHPSTASLMTPLTTFQSDLVCHGAIHVVGPDLDVCGPGVRRPFGLVVLLAIEPGCLPDPFDLENVQLLTNRLPGFMVRSVPGRLWARVSQAGLATGMTLATIGQALMLANLTDLQGVVAVEVVFVTASDQAVESLRPVMTEAKVLSGQHKKLFLSPDGSLECTDLDCEVCDEKPVCDVLRDVAARRRRAG